MSKDNMPFSLKPTDSQVYGPINYPSNELPPLKKVVSDGTTASYYELPEDAKELQDIISFKNMNGQMAEIFRATMRYGEVEHSNMLRDINKIIFYAIEEKKRLEKYGEG